MTSFWKYNKKKKESNTLTAIRKENGERVEEREEILKAYEEYYFKLLSKKEAETTEETCNEEIV